MHYSSLRRIRIIISGTREYIPVSSDKTSMFSTAMDGGSAENENPNPALLCGVIEKLLMENIPEVGDSGNRLNQMMMRLWQN
jgi:hypothetical protein